MIKYALMASLAVGFIAYLPVQAQASTAPAQGVSTNVSLLPAPKSAFDLGTGERTEQAQKTIRTAQRRRGRGRGRRRGRRGRRGHRGHRNHYYYGLGILGLGIATAAIIASESARSNRANMRRCDRRYRSFDWDTGTYVGYDGKVRICPYLR